MGDLVWVFWGASICFPEWFTNLFPQQPYVRLPFSLQSQQCLVFFSSWIIIIPTGMRWCHIVVFICISLVISDPESIFFSCASWQLTYLALPIFELELFPLPSHYYVLFSFLYTNFLFVESFSWWCLSRCFSAFSFLLTQRPLTSLMTLFIVVINVQDKD